jgi:hypothetical protein
VVSHYVLLKLFWWWPVPQSCSSGQLLVQVGVSHDKLTKLITTTHDRGKQQGVCLENSCTVCQEEYRGQDSIMQLPCKHWFHQECISKWLQGSKMCPVCMCEVGAGDGRQAAETGI